MSESRLKQEAREEANRQGADCVHTPGGVGECIYNISGCKLEASILWGLRRGIELSAAQFPCECQEVWLNTGEMQCDNCLAAEPIRALLEAEAPEEGSA